MEDHDLCHHYQITLKARHIHRVSEPYVQVKPSSINRLVTASAGVQQICLSGSPSCRSICHSSEPQTSTVYVSSPRPKCLGHRCSKHNWSGLTAYAYPPTGLLHKVIQNQAIHLPDHCNSPRLARDALVWGPSAALNRDPTSASSVNNSSQTGPQYVLHSNPQHLNFSAWCLGVDSSKNKASLWRWQRELLSLKGRQQGPSTSQSGPYLKNCAEKIQWTSPLPLSNKEFLCTCTKF